MIVTCESCKSRYKLDDAKITGRGAKITCPKCKSVFVVYAKDPNEVSRSPGAPPVAPPAPRPGGLADAVKAADRKEEGPGRLVAGGGASPSDDDAWDDEPTRVGGDLPGDGHEVVRGPRAAPVASGAPTATPPAPRPATAAPTPSVPPVERGEAAARAASLDFKKVGVTTWKVKVKIGLVYDFSDIKTLRKYIQDGRVTASDVVSWDGKTWRAIGEIPDLDVFFVETWEMLAARRQDAASDTLAPTPPVSQPNPDLVKALEESVAQTPKSGGEPNQFQDPFADMRRKQKEKSDLKRTGPVAAPPPPPKAEPPRESRLPLLGLLLLLVAGGAGAVWWMQQQEQGATTPTASTPPAPADASGDDIRERINKELKETMEANPGTPAGVGEAATDTKASGVPPEARDDLTPRRPDGVPPGARPVIPKTQTTAPAIKQADQSAADHEAVGDDAASGGDWSTAVVAYKKAVSLDGGSAKLVGKLGRAQFEAGDAAAEATLQKAAGMGVKDAHKYLGHLKAKQGDTAGAQAAYQAYLDTSPRDAEEIQQIVTKLSGG